MQVGAILKLNEIMIDNKNLKYLTFQEIDETGIVSHLFSTRFGGVSEGIFESMNLGYNRGDSKENVDENFRRIAKVLDSKVEDFVLSDQTHTTNIYKVTGTDRGKGILVARNYVDIDGLITNESEIVLSTFFADCVPLFFVDPVHKAIGLSHSGWRGTVEKIGLKTVEAMNKAYGTRPSEVIAAIGPSICRECYEVSEDVALQFEKAFSQKAASSREQADILKAILYRTTEDKYQLDLWLANKMVMEEAGIKKSNIFTTDVCTCCNPNLLFSHRKSLGKRGNLGAFMKLKGNQ